jgi:phenylalanine-4-hydroxylase
VKGLTAPLFTLSDGELEASGIAAGKVVTLEFESGVVVRGKVLSMVRKEGKLLLLTFTDCLTTFRDEVLFDPSWGVYDMAVGEKIDSAFSGPADPDAFEYAYDPPREKTHKIVHTPEARRLHSLYQQVRDIRERQDGEARLMDVFEILRKDYPSEWLLVLEILELIWDSADQEGQREVLLQYLMRIKGERPELESLVDNGLAMVSERIKGIQAIP